MKPFNATKVKCIFGEVWDSVVWYGMILVNLLWERFHIIPKYT